MYIICQNCNTNFIVDPKQIGSEGRKVKCSQCGHVWYFKPKISELENDETKLDNHNINNLSEQSLSNDDDIKYESTRLGNVSDKWYSSQGGINLPVRVHNERNSYFSQQLGLNLLTAFLLLSNILLAYFLFKYNGYLYRNTLLNKVNFQNFHFVSDCEDEKFIILYQLHNNSSKKQLNIPIVDTQIFDKDHKIINSHIDRLNLKIMPEGATKISTEFHNAPKEVSYVKITLGNVFYFFYKKIFN